VNELFAMAVRAFFTARIALSANWGAQTFTLAFVMKKIHTGLPPIALLAASLASYAQAQGLPVPMAGGSNVEEHGDVVAVYRDGISLDEAVRRAEAQYHAKVVRTDVQDEDGRKVYVLKLLSDDGRVITVRVDASTGRAR
jgi:chemotaxis receptor (MCP) glutamine deamidase CheD